MGGEVVVASPAGGGGGDEGGPRMPRQRSGEGASEHEAGALQGPTGSYGPIDSPHCLLYPMVIRIKKREGDRGGTIIGRTGAEKARERERQGDRNVRDGRGWRGREK